MSKIVYLGHYCDLASSRKNSPAAVNVMSYVIDSVNKLGYEITVVSPVQKKDGDVCCREMQRINEKTVCIYTPTLKKPARWNIPYRAMQKWRREWNLRRELARTVEDGDTLLVYHSLGLMDAVWWIRRRRNIQLILQVCELYADAESVISEQRRNKEIAYVQVADKYIFMSDMLAQILGEGKPYAVCLGDCRNVSLKSRVKTEKIHVVYAGTLDPVKGGCINAVQAARFLNERYHVHILGVGNEEQIDEIKRQICDISGRTSAEVTYDGILTGNAYTAFLQQCDIGLSTQNAEKEFNATSFPSKILSYLSQGLRVVSARIPVIEDSDVGEFLYYYESGSPEQIAEVIQSIDMNQPYNSAEIVRTLDREFREDLKKLLAPFAADGQDENNESI